MLLLCSQQRDFGKARILLGNPDTSIQRSHKNKCFKEKSKTIDALVQNIQLNEHGVVISLLGYVRNF
jgi:hypothetical protein